MDPGKINKNSSRIAGNMSTGILNKAGMIEEGMISVQN